MASLLLAMALLICPIAAVRADDPSAPDPARGWALLFDSGALWSVGDRSSPLDYTILPQLLTLQTGPVMQRKLGSGDLVVRSRFSLLVEPIVQGPETHYVGLAAAPSIEWWNAQRSFATFFAIGGGFGWMDSRGDAVPGGQGQDFNFNWFIHSGVRLRVAERMTASFGVYFQHISNGGTNSVNPGLDAVGPMIGLGWHF